MRTTVLRTLLTVAAARAHLRSNTTTDPTERIEHIIGGTLQEHATAYNISISIFLVVFAGFASGMTVGLLSIDPIQLKVLMEEGTQEERSQAARLEGILGQHHLLLVTLLLANAIAMEALPLFLNKCVPEYMAVLLSVSAILLFGEILPQALCTGKWQIPIIMKSLPLVNLLMVTFFLISWPIARLLDAILGHTEQTFYARSHLKALIRLHQKGNRAQGDLHEEYALQGDVALDSALGADEVVVIEGALDLATKHVREIMVPLSDVYMLEWETIVTPDLRREILEKGHSRVPIYKLHRHNVKGLLLVKSLILFDCNDDPTRVGDLIKSGRMPIFCLPNLQLYDLLNEFQRGRHMAFVTTNPDWQMQVWKFHDMPDDGAYGPNRLLGIATLEDVIEELIQEEIYDEFDNYQSTLIPSKNVGRSLSVDSSDYAWSPSVLVQKTTTAIAAAGTATSTSTGNLMGTTGAASGPRMNSVRRPLDSGTQEGDVLLLARNVRKIRDVRPHTKALGPRLQDLQRRLIDDGDSCEGGIGFASRKSEYEQILSRETVGDRLQRRNSESDAERGGGAPPCNNNSVSFGAPPPRTQSGRGLKNAVGIAAAKQAQSSTLKGGGAPSPPQNKLCNIPSAVLEDRPTDLLSTSR